MDGSEFFEQFDRLLAYHSAGISLLEQPQAESVRKFGLKELFTIDNEHHKDLADFVSWVISSNDRELFLSKSCNLKFKHANPDNVELIKVFVYSDSRCQVNKKNPEWVRKCVQGWKQHCEKLKKAGEALRLKSVTKANELDDLSLLSKITGRPDSFHRKALSTGEMLLSPIDMKGSPLKNTSPLGHRRIANSFNNMESFYAPDINASTKDLTSNHSPSTRYRVMKQKQLELYRAEELLNLKHEMSARNLESLMVPTEDVCLINFADDDAFLKERKLNFERSNKILSEVDDDKKDAVRENEVSQVSFAQLQEELLATKSRLHQEILEKEKIAEELQHSRELHSDLHEKFLKSTSEWTKLEDKMRGVLKKYIDLQKSSETEIATLRQKLNAKPIETDPVSSIDPASIINSSAFQPSEEVKQDVGRENSSSEEEEEEVEESSTSEAVIAGGDGCDSLHLTQYSRDDLKYEVEEIKASYHHLLASSRANIERLRNSFTELTAQNRTGAAAGALTRTASDIQAAAELARLEEEFKTMRENYEKLYRLSQAEIQTLRIQSMQASDSYIHDLAAKDSRADEAMRICETDMATLKKKHSATLKAKKAVEKSLQEHQLSMERQQKAANSELRKLQKESQQLKERSEKEYRRMQNKLEAEVNILNMELHQLKTENMEQSEKFLLEVKSRDQLLEETKGIYETDLQVKTQSFEDAICQLQKQLNNAQQQLEQQMQINVDLREECARKQQQLQEQQEQHEQQAKQEKQQHMRRKEEGGQTDCGGLIDGRSSSPYPLFHDSPDEYIVPQGDGLSSHEESHFGSAEFGFQHVSTDDEVCPEKEEGGGGSSSSAQGSLAASFDMDTIYVGTRKTNGDALVIDPNESAYINPLPSAAKISSDMDFTRSGVQVVRSVASGFQEGHAPPTLKPEICSTAKSATLEIESTSTEYDRVTTATSSVDSTSENNPTVIAAGAQSKRQSRSFKQSQQIYNTTLLKSRVLSSTNIGGKAREGSKDAFDGSDYELYRFVSSADIHDHPMIPSGKGVSSPSHRRTSSHPVSPTAVKQQNLHKTNSLKDLSIYLNNHANIVGQENVTAMRFDEALKIYSAPEYAEPEAASSSTSVPVRKGSRPLADSSEREFRDENPLYIRALTSRSRSLSSHKCNQRNAPPMIDISATDSVSEQQQMIPRQASDAVSSLTEGAESSLSGSIDSSVAQAMIITSDSASYHSKQILPRSVSPPPMKVPANQSQFRHAPHFAKMLGLSTKVFEGGTKYMLSSNDLTN